MLSAVFPLFHDTVPADEWGTKLAAIRPRHDFAIYAIDSQSFDVGDTHIGIIPAPIKKAPLSIVDPAGLTLAEPTQATAKAGELALLLGYPNGGPTEGQLTYSIARVLSEDEARAAIDALGKAGDEEGGIPFDPEVEFLVEGPAGIAFDGMSGGGVYNPEGAYVGVMVRATTAPGPQYVRVVRIDYMQARIAATLASLPEVERAEVSEFLAR